MAKRATNREKLLIAMYAEHINEQREVKAIGNRQRRI